ncbi:MAG: TonB-dependent receptor [Aquimarina sp.]|nr:TonB-dependent receptor [Aquimarina sp.]
MKIITTIILFFSLNAVISQTSVSGIVTDESNTPIPGANVYLDGTYDGGSTDLNGKFEFNTSETGAQTLIVSFLSFESYMLTKDVKDLSGVTIKLKEDINSLGSVILNAGTFSAGDNSEAAVLTPLDIVTTAGAAGDYIGAFQTLPGTSTVAEDGRLFVRGGDANETNIYIDGLQVFQPFSPSANNLPTRGRFSPFLFKGTNFSTGGYSAEYGNALSSVLLLNTIDEPEEEKTELQFINVGLGGGNTQKWGKNSFSFNAFYLNLKPYQNIVDQRVDWINPYESISGESVYRHQFDNGLLKVYGGFTYSDFELNQKDINVPQGINFYLKNRNLYLNSSYQGDLGNDWSIISGVSFANDNNAIAIDNMDVDSADNSFHLKLKFRKRYSNRFKINYGVEQYLTNYQEAASSPDFETFESDYTSNTTAVFTEANIFLSKKFAFQTGIRGSYNSLIQDYKVSPRVSLAYKISENSQLSLAYGDFYQLPGQSVLKYETELEQEKSSHYIANYLYQKNGRMFRAETYYKTYEDLIKYSTEMPQFDSQFNNNGEGFAAGLDLFWRDNRSINNLEYWVTYSYLNTERDYQNFEGKATPNFAAAHNLSVVGKYFKEEWKSMISATYNFASGRPYDNPNSSGFLAEKTKSFNSLNLSWAYLISPQKILYVSASNVLGADNIFNYQYSNTPDVDGQFARTAIRQPADRFFIVGFFWTISDNKNDNQLDNL